MSDDATGPYRLEPYRGITLVLGPGNYLSPHRTERDAGENNAKQRAKMMNRAHAVARREALEEAARVCDDIAGTEVGEAYAAIAQDCAAAIRALIDGRNAP